MSIYTISCRMSKTLNRKAAAMRSHRAIPSMIAFALIVMSVTSALLSTAVPHARATGETVIYLPLLIGPDTAVEEPPYGSYEYWTVHPLEARREVIRLVNIERVASGCSAAYENPILMDVTQAWSEYMYFLPEIAHTDAYPGDWYDEHGWPHPILGENIAGPNTPDGVVQNWMNSQWHRVAMLSCDAGPAYRYEIGVGYTNSWILTISAE